MAGTLLERLREWSPIVAPAVAAVLAAVFTAGATAAATEHRVATLERRADRLEQDARETSDAVHRIDRRVAALACRFLEDCP